MVCVCFQCHSFIIQGVVWQWQYTPRWRWPMRKNSLKCLCHHHRHLVWPPACIFSLASPPKLYLYLPSLLFSLGSRTCLCLPFSLIPGKFPQGQRSRSCVEENHCFCLLPQCLHAFLHSRRCGSKGQHWALASLLISYLLQISCIYWRWFIIAVKIK